MLMKVALVALGSVLLAGAAPADYPGMIRQLGKTVADNFYDPHMRGIDWANVIKDYERRAKAVRDDASFRQLASQMMKTLNVSHSDVSAPAAASSQASPPIVLEGDVIVEVAELSHARSQGLRPRLPLAG
jgi:hypothetical protein